MLRPLLCASALAIAAPAHAKTIDVQPSDNDQEAIQLALLDAQPGDTVHIRAGTYALSDGISLDVDGVTIRGDGPAATILSFKAQSGAGEGLLITSDRVLMTGFAIEDTRGDAIKAKGVDRITFDDVRAEWTNGPDAKNGAYGLYPVESTNILIMNSEVIAASDAGIYVGQSDNIVVRDNRVHMNVAGIEIENSTNAEVHDNHAWGNTAGVLVFDLPNLPKMGGHSTVVRDNVIVANNTPNFAAPGNIVAGVPAGTGVIVMANRNVHVVDNFFDGHASAQVMVVGYSQPFEDTDYNPLPRDIVVADNIFGRGGDDPQFEGGAELAAAVGGRIPPIMWDGAAAYLRDGAIVEEPVVMHFDTPALTLGLAKAGDAPASGTPGMAPTTDGTAIPRPDPIAMPADQPGVAPADIAMATGN